ncbi:hypothetical protein IFM89_006897, partial [Coptis chinensis]
MRPRSRDKKLKEEWTMSLKSVEDIHDIFMQWCLGKLERNPWSELNGLQAETKIVNEQLGSINLKGFLTINSHPSVNAAKSDSPSVGWGGPGGYVYYKAYVEEFFCSQGQFIRRPIVKIRQTLELNPLYYITSIICKNSISNF